MSDLPVLCYVDGPWAYFTTMNLEDQWGDDWDDIPYEHNAGIPYADDGFEIIKVAWEGPFEEPRGSSLNSPYSVKSINRGDVAWLRPDIWCKPPHKPIHAGTTLSEFIDAITAAGGTVYQSPTAH